MFKTNIKSENAPPHFFFQEAHIINLTMLMQKKYLEKEMCMIYSVDYNVTDKSGILNIHKYLMIKINIR